jgi:hypothetical protein
MNGRRRCPLARLIGVAFLLLGLLSGPSPTLWAQSAEAPPTGTPPAPVKKSPSDAAPKSETPATGGEDSHQDRQRAYRRQKDDLKEFAPSEEIRVDKAVDFPVDI